MNNPVKTMTMEKESYRTSLVFSHGELTRRVMGYLGIRELAERPADAFIKAASIGRRFLADSHQREFIESRLRLAAWHVSSALAGWKAATEFDTDDEISISITLGYPYSPAECTLLGEMVRDWICLRVSREVSLAVFCDKDEAEALSEREDDTRQRVLMFLCAADVMRRAG